MLAYNIITRSQSKVNKTNDVSIPFIFDCNIINKDNKKVLKLGVASARDISESRLIFIYPNKRRDEVHIKTKNGIQYIPIEEDNSNIDYELIVNVIDIAGKKGHGESLVVNRRNP